MESKNRKYKLCFMKDLPELLVTGNVDMPTMSPFHKGGISIRLENLSLRLPEEIGKQPEKGGKIQLHGVLMEGGCTIAAKEETECQNFKAEFDAALEEEKQQWLEQARAERERLVRSEGGQQMVREYNKHNEVYDKTFDLPAMKRIWSKGDVTKQMARDTNRALVEGFKVNDKIYTDTQSGQSITYNENAFLQQFAVAQNALYADENFDPLDPESKPGEEYQAAATSAMKFAQMVETTGNSKTEAVYLNKQEIYAYVEEPGTDKAALIGKMDNYIDRLDKIVEAGRFLHNRQSSLQGEQGGEVPEILREYTEREIEIIQESFEGALEHRRRLAQPPHILAVCKIRADLDSISITRDYDGQKTVDICLPEFDLDIDASELNPEISSILKSQVERMELLHEALKKRIEDCILEQMQ